MASKINNIDIVQNYGTVEIPNQESIIEESDFRGKRDIDLTKKVEGIYQQNLSVENSVSYIEKKIEEKFRLIYSVGDASVMEIVRYVSLEFSVASDSLQEQVFKYEQSMLDNNGLPPHLKLIELPDPFGYGIFLDPNASPIEEGELIGLYPGKYRLRKKDGIIDNEPSYRLHIKEFKEGEIARKLSEQKLCAPGDTLLVDARDEGNFTRYLNGAVKNGQDSTEHANAKVFAEKVIVGETTTSSGEKRKIRRVENIIIATRTIHPGEAVLIDYGPYYWGKIEPKDLKPDTFVITKEGKLIYQL